jgi:hypothetical protein
VVAAASGAAPDWLESATCPHMAAENAKQANRHDVSARLLQLFTTSVPNRILGGTEHTDDSDFRIEDFLIEHILKW